MKVYREKRRSCSWCKPNKTGHGKMWTAKVLDKLKRMVKEIRNIKSSKED